MLRREIACGKTPLNPQARLLVFRSGAANRGDPVGGRKMTALAHPHRQPEDLSSVALLETAKGAELHLRGQGGALLRVPLGKADHRRGLTALAMMAGTLGGTKGGRA
jgi:hypothetical protein